MHHIHQFSLLTVLFLLGACAGTPIIAQTGTSTAFYLTTDAIDLTRLLPPPPAVGSEEDQQQLAAVLAAQQARTPEQAAHAVADQAISITLFDEALGLEWNPERLPITASFFRNVSRATGPYILATKECWHTLRPFERDPRIIPPGNMREAIAVRPGPEGQANTGSPQHPADSPCDSATVPAKYSYAYPSGHATWGAMTGLLLAAMVPEKRAALFARGWEIGESRLHGGVHFPIDIASGRVQATVLVALMMQNARFQEDLVAARTELRNAMGR